MSDNELEECFELIEYVNATHKARFQQLLEEKLREWLLTNQLKIFPITNEKISTILKLSENSYELCCYFHPYTLNQKIENFLDQSSNIKLFSCQPFINYPDPINNNFHIDYNFKANELHRSLGFPIFISLNIGNERLKIRSVSVEQTYEEESNEMSTSQKKIEAEISRFLLESGKKVLKKLNLIGVPILVPIDSTKGQKFQGLMLIKSIDSLFDDLKVLNFEDEENDNLLQTFFYTSSLTINPSSFLGLKEIVDFYKDLSQRHYKGILAELNVGNKFYISGEFWYKLKLPSDPRWHQTKDSFSQKKLTNKHNKPRKNSFLRKLSINNAFENYISNSLPFSELLSQSDKLKNLPWGSTCDPLKALELSASFPQGEFSSDLELNPTIASNIHLFPHFISPKDEWVLLSKFLKDILASWPELDTNVLFQMDNEETTNYRRNSYSSIGSPKPNWGQDSLLQVNEIAIDLFSESNAPRLQANLKKNGNLEEVFSTSYLASNLFSSSSFPYQSFLWNFVSSCLIAVANNEDQRHSDFYILIKEVWAEILKIIRNYWESKQIIPNVNSPFEKGGTYEVDLRFSILHQKLSMLNYCINRHEKSNQSIHTSKKQNSLSEQDKNLTSSLPNMRAFGKQNHLTGLTQDILPKSHSNKSTASLSHSIWKDKISPIRENGEFIKYRDFSEPISINLESTDKEDCNCLQGSPEILSPPSSYPKADLDLISTEKASSSSTNPSQDPDSITQSPIPMPIKSTRNKISSLQFGRENSIITDSFVQLHCPSSISSYNSLSDIALALPNSNSASYNGDNLEFTNDEMKNEPEGRLKVMEGYMLLEHDEPIYIPITQDPGVMTEDMLSDQAKLFETLGTSETGARRRAQLQGAQLFSDMEAFKAANPRACLGDFVRWHSPRDWISTTAEDSIVKEGNSGNIRETGKLSARMNNPDNLWQELWAKARPVPACFQKPLFDFITEGEKALHYLENISVDDLYHEILPTIFLVAYDVLFNTIPSSCYNEIKLLRAKMNELANDLMCLPWQIKDIGNLEFDSIIEGYIDVESLLGKTVSLMKKLDKNYRLIELLLNPSIDTPILIQDGSERDLIIQLFTNNNGSGRYIQNLARFEPSLATNPLHLTFPSPYRREIVIENRPMPTNSSPHPFVHSSKWHRVYFDLQGSNLKMVEMFTVASDMI